MKSLIGYKIGMTQVFATDGTTYPVTVVEVEPNVVLQVRTKEKDGYDALQVGIGEIRENLVNKPLKGHFAKANTACKRYIKEIKGDELAKFQVGESIKADLFQPGEMVDVTGTTKGKGFMGVIKTYGFTIGAKGHGSGAHRIVGSMATSGRTNNRVHPGKKMPGHHSAHEKTILNLQVVGVDVENNALLIKGAIPGPNKSIVTVRSAVKVNKNVPEAKKLVEYTASNDKA